MMFDAHDIALFFAKKALQRLLILGGIAFLMLALINFGREMCQASCLEIAQVEVFNLPENFDTRGLSQQAGDEFWQRIIMCAGEIECLASWRLSNSTLAELRHLCRNGCPTTAPGLYDKDGKRLPEGTKIYRSVQELLNADSHPE